MMNVVSPPTDPPVRTKTSVSIQSAAAQGERDLLDLAALAPEDVLVKLQTQEQGLSSEQARKRFEKYGPNAVGTGTKRGFFGEIFDRFKNPLVIQLLIIGTVSFLMGDARG